MDFDDERVELVAQWVEKADSDYLAAAALLRLPDPFPNQAAFLCQQAAEKYIKAYLIALQIEFPTTHDLARLLALLQPGAPTVTVKLQELSELTRYGIEVRYPGDLPTILPGEEQRILALAAKARETIRPLLIPGA